jgi:drug/metabolite transporter (DMT)-like permease
VENKRFDTVAQDSVESARDLEMYEDSIPVRTTLFVLLLAVLWGGNVVAIKIGLLGVPPFAAAGIRFGIALPLIALWARIRRIALRPQAGEWIPLLVVGSIFTAQIAFLNWGTRLTLAGRATVILHTYPVFVAFLAHFIVPGDRLTWYRSIGVIAAFGGIVVVFWEKLSIGAGGSLGGDLLCLGSGFLLGFQTVLIKRIVQTIQAPRLLVWQMAVGVPLFFLLYALFEPRGGFDFSPAVVSALLFQAVVVGFFCFLTWLSVLKRHSPSRLTVLFGEGISIGLAIGAGMVALGIFLVNRR